MIYSCVFEDLQSKFLDYLLDVDGLDIADPVSVLEADKCLMWLILMRIVDDFLAHYGGHRLFLLFFFSATRGLVIHLLLFPGHPALL